MLISKSYDASGKKIGVGTFSSQMGPSRGFVYAVQDEREPDTVIFTVEDSKNAGELGPVINKLWRIKDPDNTLGLRNDGYSLEVTRMAN